MSEDMVRGPCENYDAEDAIKILRDRGDEVKWERTEDRPELEVMHRKVDGEWVQTALYRYEAPHRDNYRGFRT